MKIIGLVFIILLACVSVASAGDLNVGYTSDNGIVPILIEGNPMTCADMGCTSGTFFKIELAEDANYAGTYDLGNGNTITITNPTVGVIGWTSNVDINCVFMKGGAGGDSYCYGPGVRSDSGLSTPLDTVNDKPKGISHINLCYKPNTQVPEFPSVSFPVIMIIGLLGTVFYIQRTREH